MYTGEPDRTDNMSASSEPMASGFFCGLAVLVQSICVLIVLCAIISLGPIISRASAHQPTVNWAGWRHKSVN